MIWYDMIWYDMIWYDMIWYDMIWYDMIWYDMIWYDMIWYMTWLDMIHMTWHDVIDIWYNICDKIYIMWYMIYLLTAIGLPLGGSSTVHIYTQTIHRTTQWKQNIQKRTYITIRIHKHNNKNT